MADRRFIDRDGRRWDVRVRSRNEWLFEPAEDEPGPSRVGAPPGYEKDPFELSIEELQRVLDAAQSPRGPRKKSPFVD